MSDIIAEPNDDFSHGHFELQNFILAQKLTCITTTSFSDFAIFAPPPRLFQAPRLVIFHFLYPLHVYSKLHIY